MTLVVGAGARKMHGSHTAYLVIVFQVVKGFPRFRGVGIYSESAHSLTRMGKVEYADIMQWHGSTYQEARDGLVEYIMTTDYFSWIRPWVDESPEGLRNRDALEPFLKRL